MHPADIAIRIMNLVEEELDCTPAEVAAACGLVLVGLSDDKELVNGLLDDLRECKKEFETDWKRSHH